MKSIIIIIAIFLVTLTAKADWEKMGELDSLKLGLDNISFVKTNDSCTKLFIYSDKENKIQIWDLVSGKLLKEKGFYYQTLKIEYDFNNDMILFYDIVNGKRDTSLPNVNYFALWYIDSTNKLGNVKLLENNGLKYTVLNLNFFKIINIHILVSFNYETKGINNYPISSTNVIALSLIDKFKNYDTNWGSLLMNKILVLDKGIYAMGSVAQYKSDQYYYLHVTDYLKDYWSLVDNIYFSINLNEDSKSIIYDINYKYIVFTIDLKTLRVCNLTNRKISYLSYDISKDNISELKLINSPQYCVYFIKNDTLKLVDIFNNKIIDSLNFKKGKLYFNDTSKYLYSINGSAVYRINLSSYFPTTDIKDFAERKYIFKQDVDGIYCQLEGEGEVSLYDNVGRLVRTYQIENERYIRKEDLDSGVYFLSIQTNGNVYHEKVLVE